MIRKYLISFVFILAISDNVLADSVKAMKVNNNGYSTSILSLMLSGSVDVAKTFKPYDFKVGLGFDFGYAGLGVSALANVYRNFTPVTAGFAGVDLRYNFLPFKNKKVDLNLETRNKMDILFKLGARFKVNKNISLSPYAILGTGFGSIRQENGVVANTYSVRNIQNVYETILRNDNTRDIIINKYTDGTTNADASSYADGTDLRQNLTAQGVQDVSAIMHYEKISNPYNSEDFNTIPFEDLFSQGGSLVAQKNNYITQTIEVLLFKEANSTSDSIAVSKVTTNNIGTEFIRYNVPQGDGGSASYDNLTEALNDVKGQLGGGEFTISEAGTSFFEGARDQFLNAGIYESVVYNEGTGIEIPTNNYLVVVDTPYKYQVDDENAYNSLKNDITNAINTYNSTKITDNRQDVSALDSDTTTTNAVNEVKETSTENNASNGKSLIDSRNDIYVDSKQKFFFKGGLGFEMTFKDRFFVRLEYKYSKLSATRTSTLTYYNTYNNVSGTNYYTRTYDQTTTNTTNNTYNIDISINPFNSGLENGSELFDGHNVAEITTGNATSATNQNTTSTLPTGYTKDTGRSTQTHNITNDERVVNTSNGTSFDMHEFSVGFGFYFL